MPLETYAKKWELLFPKKLKVKSTSQIFQVQHKNNAAILKIFSPKNSQEESFGSYALQYFSGESAVKIFQYDNQAQLLEYVSGENLLSTQNSSDNESTKIICSVIKKFKTKAPFPPELPSLQTWFRSLFQIAKTQGTEFQKAAEIAHELLQNQQNIGVLHGDIHHENILQHPERGWIAIDPKGLIGEKTFEVANLFYNPVNAEICLSQDRIRETAKICAESLALQEQRILSFAYAYGHLKAAWMIEDGLNPEKTLEIARKIKSL